MKLTIMGSGTSTGVPQIGCHCATCTSLDPHDRRLRASAIVTLDNGANLLIDCGPDFREQILSIGAPELEALLITHSHYDHVGGIDDLRPYCKGDRHFPTYCTADVAADLRERNPWSFAKNLYPGVPTFDIHEIVAGRKFEIAGQVIEPLQVMHGQLPKVGYRIGNLAYITDCKTMPDSTLNSIKGLDMLVINALRHDPHPSHQTLEDALAIIADAAPRRALLTHLSHDMGPEVQIMGLPDNVAVAFDGLVVNL